MIRTFSTPSAVFPVLVAAIALFAPGTLDDETIDVGEELAALAKRYSIEILVEDPGFPVQTHHGAVHGEAATSAELEAYVPILVREFGRYPVDFVERMGLRRIVLCRSLAFVDQHRAAVPEFATDTMYLDAPLSMWTSQYARRVIHHEFFHIVDWMDDGLLYEDGEWTALNAEEFSYGNGGRNAQSDSSMSLLTSEYTGFLTKYSMTGVEEDKAEVFAYLFLNPDVVVRRSEDDEVLESKVERMKELLESFCPKLDPRFWTKLEKEKQREFAQTRSRRSARSRR